MPLLNRCAAAGAAALALAATNASATWSILIADTRTGEIVIASATCVQSIDLRRETPVLITGVGAVTAQSAVDGTGRNRMIIRDRLLQGLPLESVLEELEQTDAGHSNRQYGFITALGDSLTYSGIENADWAGGVTGRIEMGRPGPADDIVYSVQGNILTGPNVVDDAAQAIINTQGDLPEKLKAAMIAAQIGGGDGRCSCSNANPTGCGSPPPGPFKSAHVGYMLGTRADDIDSVRAFYPITNFAGGMAILDIDHNSMPDVVIGDASIDELSIFLNSAIIGDPLSHVLKQESRVVGAAETVAMSAGDFNADGLDDLAIALASPPTLAILLGQESGELADPITLALPATPTGMDAGDLSDGPRDLLAVSMGSLRIVKLYRLNTDADPHQIVGDITIPIDADPSTIAIGQLAGDNANDLAIVQRDANTVTIFRNIGFDGFVSEVTIPTTAQPTKVVIADTDLDESNEMIVLTEAGRRVEVFADDGKGWSQTNSITINRDGRGLAVGDFNNDALPDIITTSSRSGRNLQVFANDGLGGFGQIDAVRVGTAARQVELIDMNGNGNLDLVLGSVDTNGLMLIDNPRGTPMSNPGRFADGDYFLELNIPNQREDDPDPVDQLLELFDAWRLGLEGKVDAVHSKVIARQRYAQQMSAQVTIELRDWRGDLLAITDPNAVMIETTGTLFALTEPELVEPGIFALTLSAGDDGQLGTQPIIIRANTQGEQVRIMPDYTPSIVEHLGDFNADGRFNYFDVAAFLWAFNAQEPDADITGDGVFDTFDISAFIALLSSP